MLRAGLCLYLISLEIWLTGQHNVRSQDSLADWAFWPNWLAICMHGSECARLFLYYLELRWCRVRLKVQILATVKRQRSRGNFPKNSGTLLLSVCLYCLNPQRQDCRTFFFSIFSCTCRFVFFTYPQQLCNLFIYALLSLTCSTCVFQRMTLTWRLW